MDDLFKETLTSISFRNNQNFNDATEASDDFDDSMVVIDKVATIKETRVKHNFQVKFDGEISEAIKIVIIF